MSRCFPFPPPGYDKKPRPEDPNLLKEEKQKERKHKKEKKEREKKEGKEKKDKERSEGKHKEKRDKKDKHKDKKDKHRDKKKEKEKDRVKEKEKSSSSEVSKVSGLPEAKSAEKPVKKEGNDNNNYLDEKGRAAKFHGQNGENPFQSNLIARETEESKYVQDLGRRIRDEEKVTTNQPERLSGAEKRRDDERTRFAVSNLGNSAEDKGKHKDREFDIRKMDGQGYRGEARFTGPSMVQSLAGAAKTKVAGMAAVVEKNGEKRMDGKEKTKEKDEKRGDKHKDKDTDKKGHGKDKDREKEKKKEEKAKEKEKEKTEHKKGELGKSKDVNRINLTGATDKKVFSLSSEHDNTTNAERNLKKRKEVDINGFLHDNEIRPNKLLRPASHPVMENGRKLEASQTTGPFASNTPGVAANIKLDNRENRKNGIVEPQPLPVSRQKPPSATIVADQIPEVSKKPPHPDSKYLSQILSVPKMDEWSDFVDQDWLLGSQDLSSRKPEVGSIGVGEEPRVWSEALHLESADIVALPYVLPY